jgi:superfamily II DNA or RNA helicase
LVMPGRPYLLENLSDETTHAAALAYLVDDIQPKHPLAIASGYVNLAGLRLLATIVGDERRVRLLLGAAPDPGLGAGLPLERFERALFALSGERDFARFPPSRAARSLAIVDEWLADPRIEVRRYVTTFLHGKAYLFGTSDDARAALVTSANLTGAGLFANLELGLVHYDPPVAREAIVWFDHLWEQASDYKDDLRALLFPDPGLIDPQTVYLRALLDLYGDELGTPLPPAAVSAVSLAPFQQEGYERARRILARYHGVIYADGVGTGKTEVGLAFIEEYALRRGYHALVVAPAQLVSNWQERIDQARLPAQVISFHQLASDEQLAPDAPQPGRYLHNAKDSYRLIVIDEAHALRNPGTTWYRAMERLLGGERKDLVLLTATPINNGLWDLYHLVMVFARHDRALASDGIPSLRDLFVRAGANERDPENLNPDVLFPVADAVSVRRDRRFIEQNYPDATFPDGTPVRFPHPVLTTERYDLDAAHPGLFTDITGWIGGLTMARYRPSAYEIGGEEAVDEATLGGLLQSGILKRFESCWAACLTTVSRMIAAHNAFLVGWDNGVVPSRGMLRTAALEEIDDAGLAAWVADSIAEDTESRPIADFQPEYREAVEKDRALLVRIRDRLAALDASSDTKLALLRELLASLPAQKIAVFASFADTVAYLDEHLPQIVGGRNRAVVIGSQSDPDSRSATLARFSPDTVVQPGYQPPEGEVDLLISTDVLSEGQNLQQAAAVISYDMPWNPQRVVQRNGRVIRLKSPHDEVFLTTMLPEPGELETFLQLESAIRRKILAASVYGMETQVLDSVESELRSYAERLTRSDTTLLDDDGEDDGSGAFAGESLRAELTRAITEGELDRLRALPWGIGAVFRQGPGVPSSGSSGAFFACRTRGGQRYWRYVEREGVLDRDADILRRINPGPATGEQVPASGIDLELMWQAAAASIVEEHNRRADPRAAGERIGPVQRYAIELLRDPAVLLPPGAAEAEEALSVERSSAVRQALALIRSLVSEGSISRDEAATRIVQVVESFGLRAVEPPPALEPINDDDIGVVCWMVVLPEASAH